MRFTDRVGDELSALEAEALSNAVAMVEDFLLGELVDRFAAVSPTGSVGAFSSQFVPHRYIEFCDLKMLRRLHACLLVVAGRLQDGWGPPRCRGEELVLRAVLDHAEVCLEELTEQPTEAFVRLADLLFEDFDHEYLFDPSFDGIDDPETVEGSQMGVGPLHPSAWFDPFYDDRPVHPMARWDQ
ncbi:MAG: hypothetical protein GY698_22880 [Actinomycetia bacterium]|nr:hypothetical protein [Actinomycetes bacterium]